VAIEPRPQNPEEEEKELRMEHPEEERDELRQCT
jgi:hypothetical protein